MKKTAAFVLLALLAGCSKPPAPPPAPVAAPEPPKPVAPAKPPRPNMAPPLSSAQKQVMEAAFTAAREMVKKARDLRRQAEQIEKTSSREAANNTYVQARDLYREATESTEDWIEPEIGKVTEAQVKDYLTSYLEERGTWVKENASMGKLHKD